jgi:hypothetical protein
MCVVAELQELEEELDKRQGFDGGSQEAIAEECADVALYLIVILYDLNPSVLRQVDAHNQISISPFWPVVELIKPVRKHLWHAWEAWRQDVHDGIYAGLRRSLEATMVMAKGLHVDLPSAVRDKTERNAKRGHRHGLKHPDT